MLHPFTQRPAGALSDRRSEHRQNSLDTGLAILAERGVFLAQQIPDGCILIRAGQGVQVVKSQPAPGRAQDREPGYAVARMQQCERQSHEILNHGTFAEVIDLYGLKWNLIVIEYGNDCTQVRPRTNQHGDFLVSAVFHQFKHPRCLIEFIRKCVHVDSSLKLASFGRNARAIRYCARFQIVFGRQNSGKCFVHPLDNFRARAEVDAQRQGLKSKRADALRARLKKQIDIGLAESINRLHWIANQEKRAPIARFPSGGQLFEQLKLRVRRVLKFVDQDVLDALAHCQGQIGWGIDFPKSVGCADHQLREIHAPAFAKYHLQFGHGQRQHGDRGLHGLPLGIRKTRRW